MPKLYTVNYWGSHPEKNNDDCWCGEDFKTRADAENFFNKDMAELGLMYVGIAQSITCTEYIELDGPGVYRLRKNPHFIPDPEDSNREWLRELANEVGMMHGVNAFNDAMGWG